MVTMLFNRKNNLNFQELEDYSLLLYIYRPIKMESKYQFLKIKTSSWTPFQ